MHPVRVYDKNMKFIKEISVKELTEGKDMYGQTLAKKKKNTSRFSSTKDVKCKKCQEMYTRNYTMQLYCPACKPGSTYVKKDAGIPDGLV